MAYGIKLSGSRHIKKVAKPSLTGTYTYSTLAQTVSISGRNDKALVVSGTTTATNAGTYSVTFTLDKHYKWDDGDKSRTLTLYWTINKKAISMPRLTGSYTFNTAAQTVSISSYDTKALTVSGTRTATSSGTYTVNFAINSNYKWDDGNTLATRSATWTIAKRNLGTTPYLSGTTSFAFIEGATRSVSDKNFNATYMTRGGTWSSASLATHTVTWSLKYPNDTTWDGSATAQKSATWSITWINGTSHYSNDIYNAGWSSGAIWTRDAASMSNSVANGYLTCTTPTGTSGGQNAIMFNGSAGKTVHVIARRGDDYYTGNVYLGQRKNTNDSNFQSFNDARILTSEGTAWKTISGTVNSYTVDGVSYIGCMICYGRNDESYPDFHIQRVWLT